MAKNADKDYDYAKTWGTPIGQDCISLNASLAKWLGPRLLFLANHAIGCPSSYFEGEETFERDEKAYLDDLTKHGNALVQYAKDERAEAETDADIMAQADIETREEADAQLAMIWVAENFIHLWD